MCQGPFLDGNLPDVCLMNMQITTTKKRSSDAHVTFVRVEIPDIISAPVCKGVVSLRFTLHPETLQDSEECLCLNICTRSYGNYRLSIKTLHYDTQAELNGRYSKPSCLLLYRPVAN